MKDDRGPADLERTIDDLKKKIDHYESLDKQDLIDRLTIANAQLLSCQKEVDRLNEYVQIMELQGKGKEKTLHEAMMEGYEEEKKNET